jgi:periplasmic protein TonB
MPPSRRGARRNAFLMAAVLALHGLALWGLQTGLLRRMVEILVPAQVLGELVEPPAPTVAPKPLPVLPVRQQSLQAAPAAPQLQAVADPEPAPQAPVGVAAPQPPPPVLATPVVAVPAAAAPVPVQPRLVLPSTDADYLQNPEPVYPPMSKRLNEQGKVLVRVLIGEDGKPQKAELRQSSGYDRLDNAAMNTVMQWRYVPGKRAGLPEAMWFVVPINFVLK